MDFELHVRRLSFWIEKIRVWIINNLSDSETKDLIEMFGFLN